MSERSKRTRHLTTLEQRLLKAAEDLRAKARALEPGKEQEAIFAKARQFEARPQRTSYSCRRQICNDLN
ncbi:MAG: hypothetical protein QOE55_1269 [Acidobacteriaceae bacterium]|jgi:hypothetical protein|nr:hypothetical protein [Acidobacteriaceae bacterium]